MTPKSFKGYRQPTINKILNNADSAAHDKREADRLIRLARRRENNRIVDEILKGSEKRE